MIYSELKTGSQLDKIYNSFKEAEKTSGNKEDLIQVGPFEGSEPEYPALIAQGIRPELLKQGVLTRGDLLDADFVFLNSLGRGEKPIFNFTDAGVEFGSRRLLTAEELTQVREYQNQQPDIFGFQGVELDDVRKDMLGVLLTYQDPRPAGYLRRAQVLRRLLPDHPLQQQFVGGRLEWSLVRKRWKEQLSRRSYGEENALLQQFIDQSCGDFYPWPEDSTFDPFKLSIRGHQARTLDVTRGGALQGSPSPFLDSGFVFGWNPDITIFIGGLGYRRLNIAVFHLLSRGISEVGGSSNSSYDQTYMPLGEYVKYLYPETEEGRLKAKEEQERRLRDSQPFERTDAEFDLCVKIQERLMQDAIDWATSPQAPTTTRALARLYYSVFGPRNFKHLI